LSNTSEAITSFTAQDFAQDISLNFTLSVTIGSDQFKQQIENLTRSRMSLQKVGRREGGREKKKAI